MPRKPQLHFNPFTLGDAHAREQEAAARLNSFRVVHSRGRKTIIGPGFMQTPILRPGGRRGVWTLEEIADSLNRAASYGFMRGLDAGITAERRQHGKT